MKLIANRERAASNRKHDNLSFPKRCFVGPRLFHAEIDRRAVNLELGERRCDDNVARRSLESNAPPLAGKVSTARRAVMWCRSVGDKGGRAALENLLSVSRRKIDAGTRDERLARLCASRAPRHDTRLSRARARAIRTRGARDRSARGIHLDAETESVERFRRSPVV